MDKIIERRKREAAQKEEEQRKKKENEEEEQRMKKEEELQRVRLGLWQEEPKEEEQWMKKEEEQRMKKDEELQMARKMQKAKKRMKKEEEQRMKKKEEELQRAKNKHNKITPFSAEICAEKTEWPEKQRQLTEEEENAIADFVVGKEKEQYATMLEAHLKHWLAEGQEIIYQ